MVVVVYTSSASANNAIRNKQKAIIDYLVLHKIEFEEIDLCVHTDAKDVMRSKVPEEFKANNKVIIPPQVFNDDVYCGDYDMFFNAREMELVHTFFKVTPPPEKKSTMNAINWEKTMETSETQSSKIDQDKIDFEHTNGDTKAPDRENIKVTKPPAAALSEGSNDGNSAENVKLKPMADDKADDYCDITEPPTESGQNADISEDARNSKSKSEMNEKIQSDDNCDVTETAEANSPQNANDYDNEATKDSMQNEGQHHLIYGSDLPIADSNDDGDMQEEQFDNLKVGIESNETDQEESGSDYSDQSQ